MHKRHPYAGLVRFWIHLHKKGYTRSIAGLYRCMKRLGLKTQPQKNKSYTPKPYQQAIFPGEKVQIDVKAILSSCIVGQAKEQGEKRYQYTAIDKCTRVCFIAAFKEHPPIHPSGSCSSLCVVSLSKYKRYRLTTRQSSQSVFKRRLRRI